MGRLPSVCPAAELPAGETGEEPMEVDRQQQQQEEEGGEDGNQTAVTDQADTTLVPRGEEEGGFILEPVDITVNVDTNAKGKKRKRKLVVDMDKEFTSDTIRLQLEDYSDTLQQKLFPPPTKKAMLWKDMTTCEQLFVRPVYPFVAPEVLGMVTRNYRSDFPDEPAEESILDLEQEEVAGEANATRDTTVDVEKPRAETGEGEGETTALASDITAPDLTSEGTTLPPENDREYGMEDGMRPFDQDGAEYPPGGEGVGIPNDQTSRVIPDMPDLEGISPEEAPSQATNASEKQLGEMSEEFEKRRWTKRTQQVLRMLDRNFSSKSETPFSTLTQKCTRKQAASRFYTCLLLTKENTIHVQQATAYGEIFISKGPKFTEAF